MRLVEEVGPAWDLGIRCVVLFPKVADASKAEGRVLSGFQRRRPDPPGDSPAQLEHPGDGRFS